MEKFNYLLKLSKVYNIAKSIFGNKTNSKICRRGKRVEKFCRREKTVFFDFENLKHLYYLA